MSSILFLGSVRKTIVIWRKATQFNEKTAYQIAGEGDTAILLIHGIPSWLDEWKFLVPELVSAGYRALAMDLLGHGSSYQPENPDCYTVETAYDLFDEWFSGLNIDAPVVLVGHSFGGQMAIRFALKHPHKVAALILIDPLLDFGQFSRMSRLLFSNPALAAFFYKIIPLGLIKASVWLENIRIESFRVRSALPDGELAMMVNGYQRCSPNVVYFLRTVRDQTLDYAEIKAPTLLLWGKDDRTLSTSWYRELVRKLPDCSFEILNARHYPQRTNFPEVKDHILEFLKAKSI
ncbi:MAG TPA: alpha/beta hydrolase [Anaerolineaceae bacterium]|nr:alpha/beta hydrolase [Anaerolineaceae bacterium]